MLERRKQKWQATRRKIPKKERNTKMDKIFASKQGRWLQSESRELWRQRLVYRLSYESAKCLKVDVQSLWKRSIRGGESVAASYSKVGSRPRWHDAFVTETRSHLYPSKEAFYLPPLPLPLPPTSTPRQDTSCCTCGGFIFKYCRF